MHFDLSPDWVYIFITCATFFMPTHICSLKLGGLARLIIIYVQYACVYVCVCVRVCEKSG